MPHPGAPPSRAVTFQPWETSGESEDVQRGKIVKHLHLREIKVFTGKLRIWQVFMMFWCEFTIQLWMINDECRSEDLLYIATLVIFCKCQMLELLSWKLMWHSYFGWLFTEGCTTVHGGVSCRPSCTFDVYIAVRTTGENVRRYITKRYFQSLVLLVRCCVHHESTPQIIDLRQKKSFSNIQQLQVATTLHKTKRSA